MTRRDAALAAPGEPAYADCDDRSTDRDAVVSFFCGDPATLTMVQHAVTSSAAQMLRPDLARATLLGSWDKAVPMGGSDAEFQENLRKHRNRTSQFAGVYLHLRGYRLGDLLALRGRLEPVLDGSGVDAEGGGRDDLDRVLDCLGAGLTAAETVAVWDGLDWASGQGVAVLRGLR